MTLQSSGNPISINDLVGEYGGSAPHSLSEYYKGGSYVANHSNNANVPTSSTISLSDFYGQSNTSPQPTQHNYNMTGGTMSVTNIGYDSSTSTGSISPNPQTAGAFASGWNPTITYFYTANVKGITAYLQISGAGGVSGNAGWTSLAIPPSLNTTGSGQTLTRASASYSNPLGHSQWQWSVGWQFTTATATFGIYA